MSLLRRLKDRLSNVSLLLANRYEGWICIHYLLFSKRFRREQISFFRGRQIFIGEGVGLDSSTSFLRRSIHRIEKGIISRPRRKVFAVDYIEDTVEAYAHLINKAGSANSCELSWAHDVLEIYFGSCNHSGAIGRARDRFIEVGSLPLVDPAVRAKRRAPYVRSTEKPSVDYSELLDLARLRRSVRWFARTSVPRFKLLKAAEIATLSPSACNRQPFTFRIFDEEPYLSEVAALPPGTRGFEHQFPCIVAVVGQQRYYSDERDRHLIYIDGSLATMSFILALETLGLSSCCINWPDIEERELAAEKALKLEADERIVMFIAVGYADPEGLIPYSEKRIPEELCRFNFE